jgi:hypothetical protein
MRLIGEAQDRIILVAIRSSGSKSSLVFSFCGDTNLELHMPADGLPQAHTTQFTRLKSMQKCARMSSTVTKINGQHITHALPVIVSVGMNAFSTSWTRVQKYMGSLNHY